MALKLPTLLEGEALAITEEQDYEAKKQMVAKMAPMSFVLLDDFHRCKLQPGDSVSVYIHELKWLLDQAMPELNKDTCDNFGLASGCGRTTDPHKFTAKGYWRT